MSLTRTLIAFGFGSALVLSGCGLDSTIDRWTNDDGTGFGYDYDYGLSEVSVSRAELTGTLDRVSVDQQASSVDAWKDWYCVHIDAYVETPAGPTVMNGIEISGDLSKLRPGFTSVSDADDWREGGVQLDVIGCAGNSIYNWDFDDLAQTVEYEVVESELEQNITLNYTAEFFNWDTQGYDRVAGSLEIDKSALGE